MMSDAQGQGGEARLESHPFGGFGPPPSSGKDPYSPPTTTTPNGLTDLSGEPHLTLLKGGSGLGSFASFGDPDRLSDSFMEMRYIQLGDWDLTGYTAEGLTARLIDNRSLNDSPDNIIQYRPWEKPESSLGATLGSITTTTASPGGQLVITSNGNGMPSTAPNGKSPTTLTTLTNAFPTFSDAFGPNGQKLPSFQSQFNSFNDPPLHHDLLPASPPVTTTANGPPSLPSFHTLPPNRGYIHGHPHQTLVTSAQLQPQFIDERHIQIFPGQLITTTAPHQGPLSNGNGHHYVTTSNGPAMVMNGHHGNNGGHFISGNGSSPPGHFLELVPVPPMTLHGHYQQAPPAHAHPSPLAKLGPQTTDGSSPSLNLSDLNSHHAHHSNGNGGHNPFHAQAPKYLSGGAEGPLETLLAVKLPPGPPFDPHHPHHSHPHLHQSNHNLSQASPQLVTNSNGGGMGGTPKKTPKRKRVPLDLPLDPSAYNNNGHHPNPYAPNNNNSHDLSSEPQVSSVSSTDSDFKRPPLNGLGGGLDGCGPHLHNGAHDPGGLDKPAKKKRKRCGECTGCQKKDNCGDCAPCRNEKSHQICKMRRCEKLTEKKSRAGRVAVAVMK